MKKILALALALIMVLGLATTVSAETISTESSDTHSYEVYQIFKGTEEEGKLVEVTRGKNSSLANEDGVAAALAALEAANGKTDAEKLDVILNYVNLGSEPYGTVTKAAPLTTAEPGYYLLKDLGRDGQTTNPDGITKSLYIVKVVEDVEIAPKRGTVIPEKKVDDVNDSISADDEENGALAEQPNQDSADYDIYDMVPFTLKATLPEYYAEYSVYKLVFHDKASAGLTFQPNTVKVYLNEVDEDNLITSGYTVNSTPTDGDTFDLEFTDLKTAVPTAGANDTIIVKFEAQLNEGAVVGAVGNSNELTLEFSNDPNWVAEPDGENPPPPPPTDKTPTDKVVVFTYQVVVNKVTKNPNFDKNVPAGENNPENIPLVGATFALYKYDADAKVEKDEDKWIKVGEDIVGTNFSTFTWKGVDDGKYKLVEVDAPSGYNKIEDIIFEITAEHTEEGAEPELTELDGGIFTAVTEGEGDDMTYTGVLTTDIQNNPGAVLPGTGGVGTTIFYIVGGLLVAAAVVLLVTKKRMATAE